MAKNRRSPGGGGFFTNILRNRATLYSIFFLSIVYLFFLLLHFDFPAVFFFGLVGLVTSFFSHNMILVLGISLLVTIVCKVGGILGDPPVPAPPLPVPISESTFTTEMVIFDENGNPLIVDAAILSEIQEQSGGLSVDIADNEIVKMVIEDSPDTEDLLFVPGYQSSIMLSSDYPNIEFRNPIEDIPVVMESSYGYEFNNPFSKIGQNCGNYIHEKGIHEKDSF